MWLSSGDSEVRIASASCERMSEADDREHSQGCLPTKEKGAHCVMDHEKPARVVKKVAPPTLE